MWNRDHTDIFLELGPAETLCGLMEEIIPESTSIPCDHRLRETDAMRMACARLFALGLLDFDKIVSERKSRPGTGQASCESQLPWWKRLRPCRLIRKSKKFLKLWPKACGRKRRKFRRKWICVMILGCVQAVFPAFFRKWRKTRSLSGI